MILLMIGTTELVLIAGLALLLFGGKKLPELMKGMGQGVRSFKDGMNAPAQSEPSEDEKSGEGAAEPQEHPADNSTSEPKTGDE